MTYTLSNKCAKNLCKLTVLLKLIIKNVVTCFFGTQCRKGATDFFHNNFYKYARIFIIFGTQLFK